MGGSTCRTMVELEGNISNNPISILIDMGASFSYVNRRVVDLCRSTITKFKNPWMVLLVTGSKRRVNAKVYDSVNKSLRQQVKTNLNVLSLHFYDVLIGMDWLEQHWNI